MKLVLLYLTITLSFSSCFEKKIYTQEMCEDLSTKFFRGLPVPSKEFKDGCTNIKVQYTQKVCQKALQKMMLGESEEKLKKNHGEKIMGCFNQGDLDRFLKN